MHACDKMGNLVYKYYFCLKDEWVLLPPLIVSKLPCWVYCAFGLQKTREKERDFF
jgi:hypothetical protein